MSLTLSPSPPFPLQRLGGLPEACPCVSQQAQEEGEQVQELLPREPQDQGRQGIGSRRGRRVRTPLPSPASRAVALGLNPHLSLPRCWRPCGPSTRRCKRVADATSQNAHRFNCPAASFSTPQETPHFPLFLPRPPLPLRPTPTFRSSAPSPYTLRSINVIRTS